MKILLVDDSRTLTRILSDFLKLKGHECTTINDGRNAISLMSEKNFDAVLLDLHMPEMDGAEVINKLARNGKIKDQRIILFTASNVSDQLVGEYLDKGVHACIRKPIQTDALLRVLVRT
ncbi:MAG: response regulator [Nitrososphaerota archaeon]